MSHMGRGGPRHPSQMLMYKTHEKKNNKMSDCFFVVTMWMRTPVTHEHESRILSVAKARFGGLSV